MTTMRLASRARAAARPVFVALTALLAGGGAHAMTVSYQCVGYRPLTAEFTPRVAQVHFEGKDWTLQRVRDAREATYVDGHDGIRVVTKERELTLKTGKETLSCTLQSEALKPENLGIAPKTPPSAPQPASGTTAR
jgi:hypothetical protein